MFSRAVVRAGIKIAHSEGFNPHPKIVFASALSLGVESFCEFADIKIIDENIANMPVSESEICKKLKSVFPSGINILEVYETENAFKNFKNIDKTRFYIYVKPPAESGESDFTNFIDELDKFFESDVFVERKPGVIINVKDYISEMTISSGKVEGYIFIDVVLKTSQETFLNPENIVKAVNAKYKDKIEDYFIQKTAVYEDDNGYYKEFR
jgi:radical SAM-linked protein